MQDHPEYLNWMFEDEEMPIHDDSVQGTPHAYKSIYALPVAGWAWCEDATDFER